MYIPPFFAHLEVCIKSVCKVMLGFENNLEFPTCFVIFFFSFSFFCGHTVLNDCYFSALPLIIHECDLIIVVNKSFCNLVKKKEK